MAVRFVPPTRAQIDQYQQPLKRQGEQTRLEEKKAKRAIKRAKEYKALEEKTKIEKSFTKERAKRKALTDKTRHPGTGSSKKVRISTIKFVDITPKKKKPRAKATRVGGIKTKNLPKPVNAKRGR